MLLHLSSYTQDNLGIAGSTRAPVNTVLNNPSTIVDSRAFIDINLVGISAFAMNNMVYLDGKSFSLGMFDTLSSVSIKRDNAPYNAYLDFMLHGPSATFAVKQHAFGIHTSVRTIADVRGIPNSLGYYITEGFQYREQMGILHRVTDLRVNTLGWGETGISYGTIISKDVDAITQMGITAKRLFGVAGLGMRVDDWSYVVRDSSNMQTQTFHGEYGFNDPMANNNYINGKGWGFDIGLTYKVRKNRSESYVPHDPCTDGDYRYRVGASLLDLGRINFSGPFYRNAFNQNESSEWEDFQGANANEIADIDSLLNSNFEMVKDNSDEQNFRMKLPTAVSVQMDYNLGYNFYVYGVITYGLPRKNSLGVQRASYLGIAPRWETKRFEVSIPFSLYEWQRPQLGMMLRLNSIIIGTDNLGGVLFNQDVYGADFYMSIKYTIFKHWKCKTKKGKPKTEAKRGTRTPPPCPAW